MTVSLDGLHPTLMRPRVEAMLADADARVLGLYIVSAFRSIERQRELFVAAVKKYGSEAAARKWVAPPGKSNHGPKVDGYGTAVDVGVPGYKAVSGQWPAAVESKVNAITARHGLFSPMEWEDWHFEPIKNWSPPPAEPPEEDDFLMAIAKDDDDRRRVCIRAWCLELWGREPSVEEQNILVYQWGLNGYADLALASVADHPNAQAFRHKRGY